MKTPRERVMAYVVLALVGFTVLGLLYFMYYDRSMNRLTMEQNRANKELAEAKKTIDDIEAAMPRLKLAKKLSLPKNADTAKRLYAAHLEKLLRDSEFPRIAVSHRATPDTRRGPTSVQKKPAFTRLSFEVQAHGDLKMLTDFMDTFYRTPLLHRIKSLTINRPVTRTAEQIPGELDITLSVEALILDGAEDRQTLLPAGVKESDLPPRLARSSSQYATIAGNNVFFGPPPPASPPPELIAAARAAAGVLSEFGEEVKTADFDILPEIVFDGITIDEKGPVATLFDAASEYRYILKKRYDGTFRVDKYWYLKDQRKPLEIGEPTLQFKDANQYLHATFNILHIGASDLILEAKNKIYRWHIGGRATDMQPITKDEAIKLGVTFKDEKKEEPEKDAKDGKAAVNNKKDEGR